MKGYLKDESATKKAFQDGWFKTGDLGVIHSDGYIQLRIGLKILLFQVEKIFPLLKSRTVFSRLKVCLPVR